MPSRTTPWPPGTLCWADNHVPDLDRARTFYAAVLGWRIDDPDPAAGNFACARLDGLPVAGFLVAVDGAQPVWHQYFATDDIEATAAAITRHGGTSLFGPHDVPVGRGRFQLAADPGGAVFGVWQAGLLHGTGAYAEPGALGPGQLTSREPAVARAFYRDVFGVVTEDLLAHGMTAGPAAGKEADRWLPYFVVADVDAALAVGTRAGGRVTVPGRVTRSGRVGGLSDPFGAVFGVRR